MATEDIVLLFINLFLRLQSCVAFCDRRICRQRLSYNVLHHRCLPRSLDCFLGGLLVLPPFQDIIRSLRAPRQFWPHLESRASGRTCAVAIAPFFFLMISLPSNSSIMSAQMSMSFLLTSESHFALGFLPLDAIVRFFACTQPK